MKKIYSIATVLFLVMAVSCGGKNEDTKTDAPALNTPVTPTTTTPGTTTATTPTAPGTDDSRISSPSVPGQQVTNKTVTNGIPITINPQTTATTVASGLNPEHGKPGHRCDIAVGAPLNSPKQATPAINTNTTPTMAPSIVNTSPQINTTPAKQTVPAGMNPAHGEPGHRCDIAVGAPLNSPVSPNFTPPAIKQETPVKKEN
jgi:hypothetical protein